MFCLNNFLYYTMPVATVLAGSYHYFHTNYSSISYLQKSLPAGTVVLPSGSLIIYIWFVVYLSELVAYQHVLAGLDWLKPNEWDLHWKDGAQRVNGGVGHVNPVWKPSADHENKHMQRYQVNQKDVSTPRRDLCIKKYMYNRCIYV